MYVSSKSERVGEKSQHTPLVSLVKEIQKYEKTLLVARHVHRNGVFCPLSKPRRRRTDVDKQMCEQRMGSHRCHIVASGRHAIPRVSFGSGVKQFGSKQNDRVERMSSALTYRLFHIDGVRFVCWSIRYRAIDDGGRMTRKEISFRLNTHTSLYTRWTVHSLPVVQIVVFGAPAPVQITITIHVQEVFGANVEDPADEFLVRQSERRAG